MSEEDVDEPRNKMNDIIVSSTTETSVVLDVQQEQDDYEEVIDKLSEVSWNLKEFCRKNNVAMFNDPNTINTIISSYPFS